VRGQGQVEQIVAGERKPRDHAILALLAYGGLRRGEVMAADVGDYSREAPSLMVHGKGNKDRVVPLHAVAQGALDAYLATRRSRPGWTDHQTGMGGGDQCPSGSAWNHRSCAQLCGRRVHRYQDAGPDGGLENCGQR